MKNLKKQGEKFSKDMQRKFSQIGRSLTAGLTVPIGLAGAAMIKLASDAEETSAKFGTVFRDINKEATNSAKVLTDSFGLSSNAAKQLLGDTGDLLTGFGFTQESALDLSTEVNKLAVDLASFTNFSGGAEGASQALTKALLGERESVKSLGISILETDVQARILENTQKGLTFETERQAKAFATLQIAQDQSKNAIGDFARTQGDFANQMRQLKAEVEDLVVSFGKELLPMANRIVTSVRGVIARFSDLSSTTKRMGLVIAGIAAAVGPSLLALSAMASFISGPVLAAVAGLSLGAAVLIENWGDVERYFTTGGGKTMWTDLQATAKDTIETMTKLWESFGDDLIEIAEFSMGRVLKTIENIVWATSMLAKAANLTVDAFKNVGGAFNSVFGDGNERISESTRSMDGLLQSSRKLFDFINTDFEFDFSADNVSSTTDDVNGLAQSIERVRVATSKAKDKMADIDDLMDPATMAAARQELAGYSDALLTASTFTMDFSHRFEQAGEKTKSKAGEVSNSMIALANTTGQAFDRAVLSGEKLSNVLSDLVKQLASRAFVTGLGALLTGGASLGTKGFFGTMFGGLFHSGGIVGGSGDKMIRAKGGEMVLTKSQQKALSMGGGQQTASISPGAISKAFESAMDRKLSKLGPEEIYYMSQQGRSNY